MCFRLVVLGVYCLFVVLDCLIGWQVFWGVDYVSYWFVCLRVCLLLCLVGVELFICCL